MRQKQGHSTEASEEILIKFIISNKVMSIIIK